MTAVSRAATLPLIALLALPAEAQTRLQSVPADPSCPGCAIEAELVYRVPIASGVCWPAVAWTGTELAVAPCRLRGGELLLVSVDGEVTGRLGGTGQGPGERERIVALAADSGRVAVHSIHRLQIYQDRQLVADTAVRAFQYPRGMAITPDGGVVVSAAMMSSEDVGLALHRFDGKGEFSASFAEEPPWGLDQDGVVWRHVVARDGAIWTVKQLDDYVLERWSGAGELIQQLRPASSPLEEPAWDTNEGAMVVGVAPVDDLLWVAIQIEVPGKREPQPPPGGRETLARASVDLNAKHAVRDTLVEVFDPEAGRLVARTVLDRAYSGLLLIEGEVWAWTTHETLAVEEDPSLELTRLSLVGRR